MGRSNPGGSIVRTDAALRECPGPGGLPISLVAIEKGESVGIARLVEHDMATRQDLTPWFATLFVPPKRRNHGIGTKLVRRIVQEARTLRFPVCFLFTPDQEAFYLRRGWHLTEHTTYQDKRVSIMQIQTGG